MEKQLTNIEIFKNFIVEKNTYYGVIKNCTDHIMLARNLLDPFGVNIYEKEDAVVILNFINTTNINSPLFQNKDTAADLMEIYINDAEFNNIISAINKYGKLKSKTREGLFDELYNIYLKYKNFVFPTQVLKGTPLNGAEVISICYSYMILNIDNHHINASYNLIQNYIAECSGRQSQENYKENPKKGENYVVIDGERYNIEGLSLSDLKNVFKKFDKTFGEFDKTFSKFDEFIDKFFK